MNGTTMVHLDNGILFNDKKKWVVKKPQIKRNLKYILLSERSQSEKPIYIHV